MSTLFQGWLFWALLSAAFAALTAVLAKIGIENVGANLATLIRTWVVIAALTLIVWARDEFRGLPEVTPRAWAFLALSGLATGASWLCYFRALKIGPASQVAPIDKLSLVLVAVFAALFLGERLSPAGWAGVALMAGGAVLVARG